jgi:hypothetical protein
MKLNYRLEVFANKGKVEILKAAANYWFSRRKYSCCIDKTLTTRLNKIKKAR